MLIYAGIDEAGYGPRFGPLLVGRVAFAMPDLDASSPLPQLWQRLRKAVCRDLSSRRGRIAVNDSKKLMNPTTGLKHLEVGCLAFAALRGVACESLDGWLDALGETCHRNGQPMPPWYESDDQRPWEPVPITLTAGELAVARAMLLSTANRVGLQVVDLGAAVVFEDRFNDMVRQTRNKAATSFTFVARHLRQLWQQFGQHQPVVIVDHQSGRTRYRDLLAAAFPEATVDVRQETADLSVYHVHANGQANGAPVRAMTVHFQVKAEQSHMPAALASMLAKYTRELLMARFSSYFQQRVPQVRPTAGYGKDANRFWADLRPHLPELGISARQLRRVV